MFEDVAALWKQYLARYSPSWALDDPMHDLGAEVRERLVQLDIVLDYLNRALIATRVDPQDTQRRLQEIILLKAQLDAGEITQQDYVTGVAGPPKSQQELMSLARAADEVRLFTESFYFIAWRLIEAITPRGKLSFSGIKAPKARGVRVVRNHLLQHPDKHGGDFRQQLTLTDEGLVLKSSVMVMRTATRRIAPDDNSVDRGLYINAQELHDELLACLIRA